ncbi:hypothetical protein HYR54_03625 [Candidatus Acetothermia bacterium]|nr:hypothetical protein [Candidatus Acetothermia bacterium]
MRGTIKPALVSVIAQLQELADYNRTLAGEKAKYGLQNGSSSYQCTQSSQPQRTKSKEKGKPWSLMK